MRERSFLFNLAIAISIAFSCVAILPTAQAQVITDDREYWSPKGKEFNAVCLNESPMPGSSMAVHKNVTLIIYNRSTGMLRFKGTQGEFDAYGGNCYLEQIEKPKVARSEYDEAIHKATCKIASIPFSGVDIRILGQNKHFSSIKRLTDGQVWIVPKRLCSFTLVLPARKREPIMPLPVFEPEEPIGVSYNP